MLHSSYIPYAELPLSATDKAYLTEHPALRPFYAHSPTREGFADAIAAKARHPVQREVIVTELHRQYAALPAADAVHANIQALAEPTAFTVITAHQPSLLLGPLYYIYKIAATLNLAQQLQTDFPQYRFVPIFVMGSEDHDVEELNHIHLYGKTLTWHTEQRGAVGSFAVPDAALDTLLAELKGIMGESANAQMLYGIIEQAYTTQPTFAAATRYLVHALFKEQGLVVADMNCVAFKQLFVPVLQDELRQQTTEQLVNESLQHLQNAGFKAQAPPRPINLFYLAPQLRERIVREGEHYRVLHTELTFSPDEMLTLAATHPERLSVNVVLRPLYQEYIFPNIAYVGGGGEVAYWLERKMQFEHYGVPFPVLVRRNSVQLIEASQQQRLQKLKLTFLQLQQNMDTLTKKYLATATEQPLQLQAERTAVLAAFANITEVLKMADPTLEGVAQAERVKTEKAIDMLEGRLLRATKQKNDTALQQLRQVRDKLYPNGGLQERHDNFIPYFIKYGMALVPLLVAQLNPLDKRFLVLHEATSSEQTVE